MQRSIPKPIRARWAGIAATAGAIATGWFGVPGLGVWLDGSIYDRVQRAQPPAMAAAVSIVAIDGPSTARVGPWPWPETVLARLVDGLAARGASVIAFATPVPPAAASGAGSSLASAMIAHGAVVVAVTPQEDGGASADHRAVQGHVVLARDADGVVRSIPAVATAGERVIPALPLAIVARALGLHPADVEYESSSRLRIGSLAVSLDQGALRPRFLPAAPNPALPEMSAWQALDGDPGAGDLADRIVVIGHAGERVATPVASNQPYAAVVASSVMSVLAGQTIAHPVWARILEWLAAVAAVVVVGVLVPALGTWRSLAVVAIVAGTFVATDLVLLTVADVWVALAVPAAALLTGWGVARAAFLDVTRQSAATTRVEQMESMRALAQTFRAQGRLELAFETLRQCPVDVATLDGLYSIGLEFELADQPKQAAIVFAHIAAIDPAFRDAAARVAVDRAVDTHGIPATPEYGGPVAIALAANLPASVPEVLRVGRYEVDRELGKGAMGVVYLGRDPRINRVVAIKAIALADEFEEVDLAEAKARFFREAEMAGRLNHPGIVTIYDVGEDGRLAFIAMELLRGRLLSDYAEPHSLLPPDQVLELVARVADALHYAHQQNVVHRDIKPANIMFNRDTDELKITDFGIARLTDTSRTKTGIVLGTPSFMSPEQLEGRRLDGRSDLFSLGVSLYQLLTGQLPFRADSMTRLMQKIATEAHSPARSVRPDLPESVDSIIAVALAKNPEDRFQTGAEFAAALRDCASRVAA